MESVVLLRFSLFYLFIFQYDAFHIFFVLYPLRTQFAGSQELLEICVCVFVAEPLFPFPTHTTAPAPVWNILPKRDVTNEREARESWWQEGEKIFTTHCPLLPKANMVLRDDVQRQSCCVFVGAKLASTLEWPLPVTGTGAESGGRSLPEPVWEKCEEKKNFWQKKRNTKPFKRKRTFDEH